MIKVAAFALGLSAVLCSGSAGAEQPVFGEMPRWAGGWGVQAVHEARQDQELTSQWMHLEGVYTWKRWIRMTAKIPFRTDDHAGLGTPTLALPLKNYFNLDGRSGSWTLTPHLFVPVAGSAETQRKEQLALTLGYETESYRSIGGLSVGFFRRTDALVEAHLHGALGINIHQLGSSGHIKLKGHARWRDDGGYSLRFGPTIYWRLNDRWHAQVAYKQSLLDKGYTQRVSLRSGLAMVF